MAIRLMKKAEIVCDICKNKIAVLFCSDKMLEAIAYVETEGYPTEGERFGGVTCMACLSQNTLDRG
jgi:hypothetical protein